MKKNSGSILGAMLGVVVLIIFVLSILYLVYKGFPTIFIVIQTLIGFITNSLRGVTRAIFGTMQDK